MIVDCHTHIDLSVDESSSHGSAASKVDASIVLAACDSNTDNSNAQVSEYISQNRGKMIGFGTFDPISEHITRKKLINLKEKQGLAGIVLYCCSCGFHPAHSRAMMFYEHAEELELPVFFHNGGPFHSEAVLDFAQPYLLDEVARTFPKLKIVIGSMGLPFIQQTVAMVAKHKNVYADLTLKPGSVWHVYNTVLMSHEWGVMDKLLFGSGYPGATAQECIETLLGFNKLLGDTNLPTVPRGSIRNIIERDSLDILGIREALDQ